MFFRSDFSPEFSPHQALEGKTPSEVYKVSERRKPVMQIYPYPAAFEVKRVYKNGFMRIRGTTQFFSESLSGHLVALETLDPFHMRVWFHDLDLGVIEVAPDVADSLYEKKRPQPKRVPINQPNPQNQGGACQLNHSNV